MKLTPSQVEEKIREVSLEFKLGGVYQFKAWDDVSFIGHCVAVDERDYWISLDLQDAYTYFKAETITIDKKLHYIVKINKINNWNGTSKDTINWTYLGNNIEAAKTLFGSKS